MATKRPDGLSDVSSAVLDVLERYTMFPWPLLRTQAERVLLDPARLDLDGLVLLIDDLCKSLARFTSEEKAARAKSELAELAVSLRKLP